MLSEERLSSPRKNTIDVINAIVATIQLVNRVYSCKSHTTYYRRPGFDRWLLLAEANHRIWVKIKIQAEFRWLKQLARAFTWPRSPYHVFQLTSGRSHYMCRAEIRNLAFLVANNG